MNLNALEKVAREMLTGKTGNKANNTQLTSAERRALASQTWLVTPGGTMASTFSKVGPTAGWG